MGDSVKKCCRFAVFFVQTEQTGSRAGGSRFAGRSFHELFYHPQLLFRVRVVAQRQVEPGRFFDDRARVGEGLEALFAVVAAHAAVADAAEGHVRRGQMDDRVVDAAAAKRAAAQHLPLRSPVGGEQIQRQRLFPAADEKGCRSTGRLGGSCAAL